MKINVTRSFLPPKEDYLAYLNHLWETHWLTNHGEFVITLEKELKNKLGVKHLFFVTNGTIALQIALKAVSNSGDEIITTPFSYVATTSSIVWEGCCPVFADIDKLTWNINPENIESLISPKTKAIIATHVFGNPCENDKIKAIADKHKLKVIYDAAHAFGVQVHSTPIANMGDISTFSFHATKIFHTIEGGAIATNDDELAFKISYLRNFGHNGPLDFHGLGVNGKNSEFHAAMGLCNLKHFERIKSKYKNLYLNYLNGLDSNRYSFQNIEDKFGYNYSYFPILFKTETELRNKMKKLNDENIFPRRYFFPSLNNLPYVNDKTCSISEGISSRILCLPMYFDLTFEEQGNIIELLNYE